MEKKPSLNLKKISIFSIATAANVCSIACYVLMLFSGIELSTLINVVSFLASISLPFNLHGFTSSLLELLERKYEQE